MFRVFKYTSEGASSFLKFAAPHSLSREFTLKLTPQKVYFENIQI